VKLKILRRGSPRHGGYFDLDKKKERIKKLEGEMAEPHFWKDPIKAKVKGKELDELKEEVKTFEDLKKEIEDLEEIAELDKEDRTVSLREEIEEKFQRLKNKFLSLETLILFSGKYDERDAILAIHAGTGGTEAQDWTEMLLRMYLRFCEKKGFKAREVDRSPGTEAGIKSVTYEIRGRYAYGWLRGEAGVHRLVRISPFDAEKMRHTSFALVEVLPILEEIEEIKIDPNDLRIDTFLSSGHGGQSVQTTYSAIRIVHLPSKITVSCQNERSQKQNKEMAMKILRGKLHKLYLEERQKEKKEIRGEYHEAQWGNQIRSYVLQPYQMVKDHRTKFETPDTKGVLDGKLTRFIESYLKWEKNKKFDR